MAHKQTFGDLQEVALSKLKTTTAWLRDYITAIRHGHIHAFTPLERKVREATRNEPWGPTGTMLNQLAEISHDETSCQIIFAVIQLRLGYPPEKWRNVYKALTVLDFLLKRGSEQCVQLTQDELLYKLEDLEGFAYTTAEGKDQGVNVRCRAHAIKALLLDSQQLKAERQVNHRQRRAYRGYAREEFASAPYGHDDQDLPTTSAANGGGLRRTLSDGDLEGSSHSFAALSGAESSAPAPYMRNAGETKGITMEMNKKHLGELKQLLDLPENKYCADCIGGGAATRATWASINNGVFICMRCAGVHRGLGTHISKVRSCTLDTWLPEQVQFMQQTGNKVANAFWEARLDPSLKPQFGTSAVEPFIRRKYARAYAAPSGWPPAAAGIAAAANGTGQDRPVQDLQAASAEGGTSESTTFGASGGKAVVQPKLHSRRSGTRGTGDVRPLNRLVSVPLPASRVAASPEYCEAIKSGSDLMAFDTSPESATSAAKSGVAQPMGSQRDVFADMESLVPTISLMDSDPQILSTSAGAESGLPNGPGVRFNDPPAFPLVSQAHAALTAQRTSAQEATRLEAPPPLPPIRTTNQEPKASGDPQLHFQEESVKDWSQAAELPAGERQLGPMSVASHTPQSGFDTPLFTPRFSALYGPGPAYARMAQTAPTQYIPPDIARVNLALAKHQRHQLSNTALSQSTKQWAEKARQGRGELDELVLHAVAGLQVPQGAAVREIIAVGPAPPMLKQGICGIDAGMPVL